MNIGEVQIKFILDAFDKQLASTLKTIDIHSKHTAEAIKERSDYELNNFHHMKTVAQQIQNIFNFGSHTVFANFLRALQTTEQIINLFKTIDAVKSVVGFLGNIFGFIFGGPGFAGGGHVPGTGSSDNVPAWLTPGEFVIRKS